MHKFHACVPIFFSASAQARAIACFTRDGAPAISCIVALVDTRTRTDRLADQIADAILVGSLEPGMRLDEQGLAERFGVSRTPVREALRQLAASGLIIARPRRGAVVASVTPDQLNGLFVAMGEIEATCARLAALSMTPLERRALVALHERMGMLARRGRHDDYLEANQSFHAQIYGGAHNSVIEEFAIALRRRLEPYRRMQFRAPGRLRKSHAEHDDVVRAIVAGDAIAAHAGMLSHVNLVEIAYDQLADREGRKRGRR
jgi:DNA-binding GntR family transcriptional regulator